MHPEHIVVGLTTKGACKLITIAVTAHKGAVVRQSVIDFCLVVCTMNTVHLQLCTDTDSFKSALAV